MGHGPTILRQTYKVRLTWSSVSTLRRLIGEPAGVRHCQGPPRPVDVAVLPVAQDFPTAEATEVQSSESTLAKKQECDPFEGRYSEQLVKAPQRMMQSRRKANPRIHGSTNQRINVSIIRKRTVKTRQKRGTSRRIAKAKARVLPHLRSDVATINPMSEPIKLDMVHDPLLQSCARWTSLTNYIVKRLCFTQCRCLKLVCILLAASQKLLHSKRAPASASVI